MQFAAWVWVIVILAAYSRQFLPMLPSILKVLGLP